MGLPAMDRGGSLEVQSYYGEIVARYWHFIQPGYDGWIMLPCMDNQYFVSGNEAKLTVALDFGRIRRTL